jgi:AcrR family transcriptional regulator
MEKTESITNQLVRQRLLAGATELFARKGYASTSVREIVEAAGVSKPVLYYYFRNKEGIYLEVMGEAGTRFENLLNSAREEIGAVRERILHLSDQVFLLFLDRIELARVGYSILYGPPQGAPFFDFEAFRRRFHEMIERLTEEGIQKGEFRRGKVTDMTWAIVGAINMAIEIQLWHPERAPGRKGLTRILNIIFEGICSKEGRKKGEVI